MARKWLCSVVLTNECNETFAVPKFVFWVDDYPKTASGKIQKFKLREMGEQMAKEGQGLG